MFKIILIYLRRIIKIYYLRYKGVNIDFMSSLNLGVALPCYFKKAKIINSKLHLSKLGNGCFIEYVIAYGNVEIDDNVSISGPGTVLHAVKGKIKIGRFSSIAQNVTIQEFNHKILTPSTYAMNFFFFTHNFEDDVVSKGDVVIDEDVWIGSNVVILSGVKIGRGAIVAAGSIVTKDVAPYSIVCGVPAKLLKMRFTNDVIKTLEKSKWWEWELDKIRKHKEFFTHEFK